MRNLLTTTPLAGMPVGCRLGAGCSNQRGRSPLIRGRGWRGSPQGLATERRITCWASRRTTPASPDKPRYGRQAVAFDFGVGLAHRAARTAAYGPCEAVAPAGRDTDRQRYGAGLSSKSTAPNVAGRARQVAQEPAAAPGCPRPRGVGSRPGAGGSWDCGEARSLSASVCKLASAGTAPVSGWKPEGARITFSYSGYRPGLAAQATMFRRQRPADFSAVSRLTETGNTPACAIRLFLEFELHRRIGVCHDRSALLCRCLRKTRHSSSRRCDDHFVEFPLAIETRNGYGAAMTIDEFHASISFCPNGPLPASGRCGRHLAAIFALCVVRFCGRP